MLDGAYSTAVLFIKAHAASTMKVIAFYGTDNFAHFVHIMNLFSYVVCKFQNTLRSAQIDIRIYNNIY